MSVHVTTAIPRPRPHTRASVGGRFLGLLLVWQARARERQMLAALDDRLLKDIGLDRGQIVVEADKPFWRA
jgi:uncharacterized protein YjiS (DUF1127 family)